MAAPLAIGQHDAAAKPCPICGRPPDAAMAPFCSKRCADVDLHKWLGGLYAVPAREDDSDESGPGRPDPASEA